VFLDELLHANESLRSNKLPSVFMLHQTLTKAYLNKAVMI